MRQRELACFRELLLFFRRQRFASRLSCLQLLLQLLALQPHRWFLQAMARPCRQQRRDNAHEEEASPAVIRKNDSRQDRSEYSPRLPAHRHARRSTRALCCRPGLRDQRHADPVFPAKAEPCQETKDIEMHDIVCKSAGPGEDRENDDGQCKGMHTTEVISKDTEKISAKDRTDQRVRRYETAFPERQAKLCNDRCHGKGQDQNVQSIHRIPNDRSPHDLPSFLPGDTSFLKFQFFQRFFRHNTSPACLILCRQ